ncbi:hypothetical protein BUALT_Bualt12G0062900 [Buddleja alternifolia]|uniref:F-box protein n=1 Tax=Buddleja alternifolia TaxID=168488 RepID=A0AAV6WWD4_9LAMI|nr:hypothetical protein BUALT_Bualt12G0062900 [Buddleja alternifolia]
MDLAYDPRESLHYKIICIRHLTPPDGPDFEIEIFSSESGFWRICQGKNYNLPPGIQFQVGIYWKNSLHYLNPYSGVSCYFRIEDETLRSLPMPPMQSEVYTEKRSWYMGQSGGHLHLVDIQKNIIRDPPIGIYELMDDYSGWELKFRVELGLIGSKYPEMVHYIDVIQLVFPGEGDNSHRIGRYYTYTVLSVIQKEGEEDFMEIVMSIPHKIICYNPRDNTSKVLVYFGDDNDRVGYEWNNVVQYTETLLPV